MEKRISIFYLFILFHFIFLFILLILTWRPQNYINKTKKWKMKKGKRSAWLSWNRKINSDLDSNKKWLLKWDQFNFTKFNVIKKFTPILLFFPILPIDPQFVFKFLYLFYIISVHISSSPFLSDVSSLKLINFHFN